MYSRPSLFGRDQPCPTSSGEGRPSGSSCSPSFSCPCSRASSEEVWSASAHPIIRRPKRQREATASVPVRRSPRSYNQKHAASWSWREGASALRHVGRCGVVCRGRPGGERVRQTRGKTCEKLSSARRTFRRKH